jgi:hypothetical protein
MNAAGECRCPDTMPHFEGNACVAAPTDRTISVDSTNMYYRITMRQGEKVTLREEMHSGATEFFWTMPDMTAPPATTDATSMPPCINVVDQKTEGTSRWIQLIADGSECRYFFERTPTQPQTAADTQVTMQKFEFIVWPTREPEVRGHLIDLDRETQTVWDMPVNSEATIRLSEMEHDMGFAWKAPTHAFTCLTVTPNFSGFQTGYIQYLVKAPTAVCVEKFTLERADWWAEEPKQIEITVNVVEDPVVCIMPPESPC